MIYMGNLQETEWPNDSGLTDALINDPSDLKHYYDLDLIDIYQRCRNTFELPKNLITNTTSVTTCGNISENREEKTFYTSTTSVSTLGAIPENVEEKTLSNENATRWDVEYFKSAKQGVVQIVTGPVIETQTETPKKVPASSLVAYVRDQLNVPFATRLGKRLDYLEETSREEYLTQAPIFPQSLQNFIDFLETVPNLAYPNIVLTPLGNIRARWRETESRYLAVEFQGNDDIRFVVFAPDKKDMFKVTRSSGQTSIGCLMDILRPYGVLRWVTLSEVKAA